VTATTPILSLSERIAEGIVALIHDDGLRPGDALLSSRDLARRFDVTTPTVREALRRLEATDVIRFRHGSGTYVGDGITRRLLANPYVGQPVDLDPVLELIDARLLLEPTIAAAAATNRTEEQLVALERASTNALVPQHADERPDLHFHVALADASGNRLVGETVSALLHVRSRDQVAIRHRYRDRDRDHAEHREILDAVRDQDAAAAFDITRRHLLSIRETLSTGADQ